LIKEERMGTGWIAFIVLLAYIAGIASAMVYGGWVMRRQKAEGRRQKGKE